MVQSDHNKQKSHEFGISSSGSVLEANLASHRGQSKYSVKEGTGIYEAIFSQTPTQLTVGSLSDTTDHIYETVYQFIPHDHQK